MKHNSPLELIHIEMSYKTAEELRSLEIVNMQNSTQAAAISQSREK